MNRRIVTIVTASLVAAPLAALASPALAQNPSPAIPFPVTPQPAENLPSNGQGGTASPQEREQRTRQGGAPQDTRTQARQAGEDATGTQGGQRQSQADARYIGDTMALATVSLQESNFAASKTQNPELKRFATFEIAEQTALIEVLHSFAEPEATASTGARRTAATAPVLPQEAAQRMERFSRAAAGPAFDREYLAAQKDGHRRLLEIQERYAGSAQNAGLAGVARLSRGRIEEHLALLERIEKELR